MYHNHPPSYEIRRFVRDNEICPYLLRDGVPLILPSLWVEELRIAARPNTLESYLRDLSIIYKWAESESIDIEERLSRLLLPRTNFYRSETMYNQARPGQSFNVPTPT